MKRRGIASARLERWWTKCNGTGSVKIDLGPVVTVVVNCLYLAFKLGFLMAVTKQAGYKYALVIELILYIKPIIVIHPVVPYSRDIMPRWAACEIRFVDIDRVARVRDLRDSLGNEIRININTERGWRTAVSPFKILRRMADAMRCTKVLV